MSEPDRAPGSLDVAFKEWASVVRALERGVQTIILRKGGIAEEGAGFAVEYARFWLFPTYFHQQRDGLRPEHKGLFEEAMRGCPSEGRLSLTSWAEVVESHPIEREEELGTFDGRHIYERQVLLDRLAGRYGKTLHVLEVKIHLVEPPLDLPMLDVYGGCRSWVALRM